MSLIAGKKKRLAFLDMLLFASRGDSSISNDDIQEEVDTFMFEVRGMLCFILFNLINLRVMTRPQLLPTGRVISLVRTLRSRPISKLRWTRC